MLNRCYRNRLTEPKEEHMRMSLGGIVLAIGLLAVSSASATPTSGTGIATAAEQAKLLLTVQGPNSQELQCGPYGKAHNCTAMWSRRDKTCVCAGK
jgi:hypothetical protein